MTKIMNNIFKIRNTEIRNRICLPPMVMGCYNKNPKGYVCDDNIEHYRSIARGGAGLIIQEATCVNTHGKLSECQLGIWEDGQIEGLKKIVDAVHAEGSSIFVQIHDAGVAGIANTPLCPSAYVRTDRNGNKIIGKEMTIDEIHQTQQDFINAAIRAEKAGYDGIELHGCHNYLISQFLNSRVNMRTDKYGQNAISFVTEIYEGIRKEVSDDFIIGIRLGAFEPTLNDGISHAKILEEAGFDFLDISYGFKSEAESIKPEDFPYTDLVYAAKEIKKNVGISVFAVNNVRREDDVKGILELCDVDMVDVGRSFLVDNNWANKVIKGEIPGKCVNCKHCTWHHNPNTCAGRKLMERQASTK